MSKRKAQREIDKAIRHLMNYRGPNNEWAGRLEELEYEWFAEVAEKLSVPYEHFADTIMESPFQGTAFVYLFEEFATALWDNESQTLIETYLKHRGWREGSAGRCSLTAA